VNGWDAMDRLVAISEMDCKLVEIRNEEGTRYRIRKA